MPRNIWFKTIWGGFICYPVSWEGWLTVVLYVYLVVDIFRRIDAVSHSGSDTLINFAIPFIALTGLFWLVGRATTDYAR
jgi:hypothetical protein